MKHPRTVKGSTRHKKRGYKGNVRRRNRMTRRRRIKLQRGGNNPPSPTIDLVIARYREDLDWLDQYTDISFNRIFLYNKSDEPIACPPIKGTCIQRQLQNVGMCDHTYIYHMIENYNDLADLTIFIPASGDLPHKKSRTDFVIRKTVNEKHPVMTGFIHNIPVHQHLSGFTLDSHTVSDSANKEESYSPTLLPADIRPFGKWYETFLPGVSTTLEQNAGIFSASRDLIRANPVEFYRKFLDQLTKGVQTEVAHYMERAWSGILKIPREWFYDVNKDMK